MHRDVMPLPSAGDSGGIELALLLYKIDPVRHALATMLARAISYTGASSGVVDWSLKGQNEPRFPSVVVGRLHAAVTRFVVGEDDLSRSWAAGLVGAVRMPDPALLGEMWGSAGLVPPWVDEPIPDDAPLLEHALFVLNALAVHGWALDAAIGRFLGARLARRADELGCAEAVAVGEALESGSLLDVLAALMAYGHHVSETNLAGAARVFELAYEAAIPLGDVDRSTLAAWQVGRSYRRAGDWDQAQRWYSHAAELADFSDDLPKLARILEATAIGYHDRGATPTARKVVDRSIGVALASGDKFAIGSAYRSAGVIACASDELRKAQTYFWRAAKAFDASREWRAKTLVSLGTTLRDSGDLEAAELAYQVALPDLAGSTAILTRDALAYVLALRGDAQGYDLAWEGVERALDQLSPVELAQVLLYRGRALHLLGREADALAAHKRSIDFSRARGFLQFSGRSHIEIERTPDPPRRDQWTEQIEEWLAIEVGAQPPESG